MTEQADLFGAVTSAEDGRIDLVDAELYYHRDFIAQPQRCYQRLLEEVQWRQDTIMMYGRPVKIPRLNAWYGDADADYSYSGLQLAPLPWTPTLQSIREAVEAHLNQRFNSVLANLYRDGNDSVAWHSDDEPELGPAPLIASVSLGEARTFQLRHRRNKALGIHRMVLQPGSLLVMRGETQRFWHHQVPKQRAVTAGRINLTFRRIRLSG